MPSLGPQFYQIPLPGMGKMKPNPETPVGHFFKNPQHPVDVATKYNAVTLNKPTMQRVHVNDLHPTQEHVDEGYIHDEPHPESLAAKGRQPAAIQHRGRLALVDGHHRAVRAMLNGSQFLDVEVYPT
jgi:hypothetical protein